MALFRLETVKRVITARRAWFVDCAILVGTLLAATVLRLAVDGGARGFPFLTFFPVVLLSAVFLGARYAVAAAVISAVIVGRLLLPAPWLVRGEPAHIVILVLYGMTTAFIIATGQVMRSLVLENEAHRVQQDTFNTELQHRTKNALQIMRALIARGPRGEDPSTYFETLAGRLDALAKANELLRFGVLESASLEDLLAAAISPFDERRFDLEGPPCDVSREAATPLMMALHELCTNATKYGALSTDHGSVLIRWTVSPPTRAISLRWTERGGPAVVPPRHRGLGMRLLSANSGLTQVDLDWQSQGLVCRLIARGA